MSGDKAHIHVTALQNDVEGLLKLLGGTEEERWRFWEILKGITSRPFNVVVQAEVDGLALQTKAATQVLSSLKTNAQQLGGRETAV
jgi:hypothetical protein